MNEEFNDIAQVYFPRFSAARRFFYDALTSLTLKLMRFRRWFFGGTRLTNERVVEYAQMLQWIRPGGKAAADGEPRQRRVLDVGCVSSRLPLQLASLGYDVYGVDLSDYQPVSHPQFHFYKENLFTWKPPVQFDAVILLSTLEHIGHGAYGDKKDAGGDAKAIDLIFQWLVPGGQILISVPFGAAGETAKHRIYNSSALLNLFPSARFRWVNQQYFQRIGGAWFPVPQSALADIQSPSLPVNGVAVLDLERLP